MTSLKTKNVFITGGAAGLGKSYIEKLLEAGARVVFGDLNEETGKATEKEFADRFGADNVMFIQFNVTDHNKFEEAFKTAVEKLGFVDLMVNNAGIMVESKWELMVNINYIALIKGTYMAMDHMRKDKGGRGGRIINVSSLFGLSHTFAVPAYSGTKHAVRAFTTCLALAPVQTEQGIEFGVLCPGAAATELCTKADATTLSYYDHVSDSFKSGEMLSPIDNIAQGFMQLATQEVMNGAVLFVYKEHSEFVKVDKEPISWPPEPKV